MLRITNHVEIRKATNKRSWNNWLLSSNDHNFPQSWEWGDVLIAEGKDLERIEVVENEKVFAQAQIIYYKNLGFVYGFCPKGPVFQKEASADERESIRAILEYLKNKGCTFLRTEPVTLQSVVGHNHEKSIDVNPRASTRLDLRNNLDQLLQKMHQKTRYNINLAARKMLSISWEKDWENFWKLMKDTGRRDGFRLHEKKHYESIFVSPIIKQVSAKLNGKVVATNIMAGFGDTFTYLFGASDYKFRSLMAPHLLQWEAIKKGKDEGFQYYDFFGIAPHEKNNNPEGYPYDPKHQYAGVTRFKLGFGGEVFEQPGTYDLIIRPVKYKIYKLLRTIRRLV